VRRYHVIAFTPDLGHALAIRTSAGWLLPRLDGDTRLDLPRQLHATLSDIAADVEVIHEALVAADKPAKVYHGYCTALVSPPIRHPDITAVSVSELLSVPSLVPLQRQALMTALSRLKMPVAPFDAASQVNAALTWAEQQIGRTGARILSTVRHRCARHEYAVQFLTTHGTFHFKAGPDRVPDEARLTDRLWSISPRQFPQTFAIDDREQRWLYKELRGNVLMEDNLSVETASASVRAYAALQKRAGRSPAVEDHLAGRRLKAFDLLERVDVVLQHARRHPAASEVDARPFDEWCKIGDAVADTCTRIDAWGLPMTLALSDFWPGNVIATPEGFGFIDLEYSFWSYPFLSLWLFLNDVERFLRADGAARHAIEVAFVAAWADVVPPADMTRALRYLPLLGRLLRLLVESRRLDLRERGFGLELPAWYRIAYLAPFVKRCVETVEPNGCWPDVSKTYLA
jgi:hypothetical protein